MSYEHLSDEDLKDLYYRVHRQWYDRRAKFQKDTASPKVFDHQKDLQEIEQLERRMKDVEAAIEERKRGEVGRGE